MVEVLSNISDSKATAMFRFWATVSPQVRITTFASPTLIPVNISLEKPIRNGVTGCAMTAEDNRVYFIRRTRAAHSIKLATYFLEFAIVHSHLLLSNCIGSDVARQSVA